MAPSIRCLRSLLALYGLAGSTSGTNPDEWSPLDPATGLPHKFDDLPADLIANVNTVEPPYNRRPGDRPALSEPEIQDVVAFLQTLSDGFTQ